MKPDLGQDPGWLESLRSAELLLDPKYDVLKGLVPAIPLSARDDDLRSRRGQKSPEMIPFRLRWAYTIHKSQGMTLDRAVIVPDTAKFFNSQLMSVALSSVRTMEGIALMSGFQEDYMTGELNNSYSS